MIYTRSQIIPRPGAVVISDDGVSPLPTSPEVPSIIALTENTELATVVLTSLANGFVLGVSLPDDSLEWWKLRLLGDGEVGVDDGLIISTTDPTRCWIRIS